MGNGLVVSLVEDITIFFAHPTWHINDHSRWMCQYDIKVDDGN